MGLFGKEKITLMLDKFNFKPGDTIKGNISLHLKKPMHARKLEVSLIGKRKTRRRTSRGSQTYYETIYDFDIPVDGEKEYQNEQYPFEIKIPSDILSDKTARDQIQDTLEEKIGTAGTFVSAMTMGTYRINWEVRAQLDVPMKLDVKNSQDIVISE